jgi:2-polyprenyl-6-methoxyphenol hydroxylase-like FAD-dependent oxidoreductase
VSPHALISGASIAGPALAHQLLARGWRTTVLERAPQRREEGHNIDVRGAAREVLRRMGLEDAVRAAGTGEVGLRFRNEDGTSSASFPVSPSGGPDGGTAELEILRGELSRVLIETTRADTDYRFGEQISALDDHGDHVTATLAGGGQIDADVVVVAEGLRSRTRGLVFPDATVRDLNMALAYLTIPRTAADDAWWTWCQVPGRRAVHLRPDNLGTTRAMLSIITDVHGLESLGRADQVTVLRRTFADVGWEAPRVLAALDDAPFYFETLGQARVPRWSSGRIALLGDAAWCASPIGGGSASLALVGAHVLAGELATARDPRQAFERYERFMRPPVTRCQDQRRPPELLNPRTAAGIRALHAGMRIATSPPARSLGNLLGLDLSRVSVAAEDVELPTYPQARPVGSTV